MRCADVRPRIVAFFDDELGPSEAELVQHHLDGCPACAAHAAALGATRPVAPDLEIPPEIARRLAEATDLGVLRARAAAAPPPATPWLQRPARLSTGAVLALLALATLLGFGASRLWPAAAGPTVAGAPSAPVPADQFQEAAYEPTEH